ncbi:hypothetical protein [Micromonospora globbae]|nr:hypothetical protein OH732_00285 [Micromonospora globbae]
MHLRYVETADHDTLADLAGPVPLPAEDEVDEGHDRSRSEAR